MNKADKRDFDSHYEYWDKMTGGDWRDVEIQNLIDNLSSLSECLLAGEDYCSVAIVEEAISFIKTQL